METNKNKCDMIELWIMSNCSFYNNVEFYVEHAEENEYLIHWMEGFIDIMDLREIEELYHVTMIEVASMTELIICITDEDEEV